MFPRRRFRSGYAAKHLRHLFADILGADHRRVREVRYVPAASGLRRSRRHAGAAGTTDAAAKIEHSGGDTGISVLVLFGSAMLYGDGVLTPAISVVSAIEGLDVWTTAAHPFIVPLSIAVLVGLFALQPRGTEGIGKLFGPVTMLWFIAIGVAG